MFLNLTQYTPIQYIREAPSEIFFYPVQKMYFEVYLGTCLLSRPEWFQIKWIFNEKTLKPS